MSEENLFVDTSRMLEHPKCAIHCRTNEEANALIRNLRSQYPEYVTHFNNDNGWHNYGKNTAYTLFYSGDTSPTGLSRTKIHWFKENGYEVIPFTELCMDQVEIEESDMPIETLFGF